MLQEYESALCLAKENYETYPGNAYHTQAYFMCLIKGDRTPHVFDMLRKLIDGLANINTPKSKEMLAECRAMFEAYQGNETVALETINKSIETSRNKRYGYITKFEICERFKRLPDMKDVLEHFHALESDKTSNQIVCFKSIIMAMEGNVEPSIVYFEKNIRHYTDQAKERFIQRLRKKE